MRLSSTLYKTLFSGSTVLGPDLDHVWLSALCQALNPQYEGTTSHCGFGFQDFVIVAKAPPMLNIYYMFLYFPSVWVAFGRCDTEHTGSIMFVLTQEALPRHPHGGISGYSKNGHLEHYRRSQAQGK